MPRTSKNTQNYHDIASEIAAKFEPLISKGQYPSLATLVEEIFNFLMLKERDFFLSQHQDEQSNGFYSRTLNTYFGKLKLKIPRIRSGNSFRPALLPPRWKRFNKEYEEFVLACLANGYSKAKIKSILDQLKIPFSSSVLENLLGLLVEKLEYFKKRHIPDKLFALFIDAYHTEIKEDNRLQKVSVFTALGIDLDGYKHILGYWIMTGGETIGFWQEVFQDLLSRGLSKVLIIVTDDFPGLSSLISKLFPLSDHQLCLLHFYRNLKRKLIKGNPKELYKFTLNSKLPKMRRKERLL
ncbi:MAG: transposase [Archaeoglobaceae archaeon]